MDLAILCLQEFLIENSVDIIKNLRFRAYDEKKKTKLSVYNSFSESLLKLRFNFSTVLIIELKGEEEEFEEYNPDWLFLRVLDF